MLAILQFDSPALPQIEQLLAQDRLPTLAALRRRGKWETLDARSTVVQSATYPTLATGLHVTEHGLYSAFPWSASDQRVRFAHAFPKPPTIWERLTRRGVRSLVMDPLLAWPPAEMAGVYVNGWQFGDRMVTPAASMPRGVRGDLSRRHGRPPNLDDVYGRPRPSSLRALREHLVRAPRRAADAVIDLLAAEPFELLWLNFSAAHKAGHHLWDPAAVVDEPLAEAVREDLRGGLADVYVEVDTAIGRILDVLPSRTDVIVFSPLGMGANKSRADLLPGMLDALLARETGRTKKADGGARTPVWSLRSRIPVVWRSAIARILPERVVADMTTRLYMRAKWPRTPAIAVPGEHNGYVRLNLKGREREGIVNPADADELLEAIAQGLTTFRDDDGSPSIARVERSSDLTETGPYADRLPDLVVTWGDRPAARVTHVSSPHYGNVARYGVGSGRSGNHTDEGWAVVVPGASRVRELGRQARITDIGATACNVLGADVTGLSGASLLEPVS